MTMIGSVTGVYCFVSMFMQRDQASIWDNRNKIEEV